MKHSLRAYVEDSDGNFLRRGWASSMRRSPWSRGVPGSVFWPSHHALMRRLIPASTILVASDPADAEHIYGCVVAQNGGVRPVVHWLYVKGDYRRLGLGSALLEAITEGRRPIYVTQWTDAISAKFEKAFGIVPSPYLLTGTHQEQIHGSEYQGERSSVGDSGAVHGG